MNLWLDVRNYESLSLVPVYSYLQADMECNLEELNLRLQVVQLFI